MQRDAQYLFTECLNFRLSLEMQLPPSLALWSTLQVSEVSRYPLPHCVFSDSLKWSPILLFWSLTLPTPLRVTPPPSFFFFLLGMKCHWWYVHQNWLNFQCHLIEIPYLSQYLPVEGIFLVSGNIGSSASKLTLISVMPCPHLLCWYTRWSLFSLPLCWFERSIPTSISR